MVYCVEVSDPHLLLIRRNGKVVISGNSGTTLKMAKMNNRNYLGIDINEDYVKLSEERVNLAVNYTPLKPNGKLKFIVSREETLSKRKKKKNDQ